MKIKFISVDDAPLALKKLEEFSRHLPGLDNLGSFTDSLEALIFAKGNDVDLIFLDIQMERLSGLQFIAALQDRSQIVITSGYPEYAVEGFKYNVTDYLLKPYSFERFVIAIDKVRGKMNSLPPVDYIFVKSDYRIERIDLDEILYIKGEGAYLKFVMKNRNLMTLMNFNSVLELLPSRKFVRVHKSYIIALDKVTAIEKCSVLIEESRIPVSESFKKQLMNIAIP